MFLKYLMVSCTAVVLGLGVAPPSEAAGKTTAATAEAATATKTFLRTGPAGTVFTRRHGYMLRGRSTAGRRKGIMRPPPALVRPIQPSNPGVAT